MSTEKATEIEIKKARELYQDENLEIDDGALVSRDTENRTGFWVGAWVWVNRE